MSIYVMADLHLSFAQSKPMDIFGDNWENHAEKIKQNWIGKVKEEDYVILPGDFSWATYIEDTKDDFAYLNKLPGNKILLKGNHDYWWTTLASMRRFIRDNGFTKIDFLYNNSYCIDEEIIVGTRGWNILDNEENGKMIKREVARLELSIQDGINRYGKDKKMVAFLHYPPIINNVSCKQEENDFINILKKYGIKKCYYGHLHGNSYEDAVIGEIDEIDYRLISADYLKFDLVKVI